MSTNVESLLSLDRLVHEPARLVILTILAETEEAEFSFLQRVSGLTKGNMSSHISKLEAANYLEVRKSFRGKVPATSLKITRMGRTALKNYRKQLYHVLQGES
jgi:DNA-binding transcriptional ArsR family regulator